MLLDVITSILTGLFTILSSFGGQEPNYPPYKTTIEQIESEGYASENHYVYTSDHYILNIHRIPRGKFSSGNGKVILLVHGLQSSSAQWIFGGSKQGLGYILADEGYDVWMLNARGNVYSRNHTELNPDSDAEFWNFSWHEIGIYDLPATINYILGETNQTGVYYVGHSQGTTVMFVLTSMLPEFNAKIRAYVSLSPVVFIKHLTSLVFRIPATLLPISEMLLREVFGRTELLSFSGNSHHLLTLICSTTLGKHLCARFLIDFLGSDPLQLNETLIPELFSQFPAGSSSNQYFHYLQEINSGHFRQYQYQITNRSDEFHESIPLDYDLSRVTAPGILIYSRGDSIADFNQDIPKLIKALGNRSEQYLITSQTFNHMDYCFGVDAPKLVYAELLNYFSRN